MKQTRRSRRATRQRKRILMISGVVLAAILIVFVGVYLVLRHSVNKVEEDTICNNVFIDKIDVSGMKSTQAKAAIEKKLEEYGSITVGLEAEEVKAEVLLSELGFQMKDVDKLVKKAVSYGKKGGVWSRYSLIKDLEEEAKVFDAVFAVDAQLVEKVIAEKIPELKNAAKDATITRQNDAFVITDEVKGVAVDVNESVKTIEKYFNTEWSYDTGNIKLVTKVDEPKVTRAQLETIKDVLGTFTTNCGTGGGRVQNIKTGAAHINGKLLMPGEEYSANAAMEPYTAENGFTEAGSYENGKVVQSMGGGICQVSSTLYNAVILAELEIVERAAHSMLVSYVEPSMDAAIAGDFKDLKFKNNLDTPVYIEGYVKGAYITFNIYGKETRPEGRTVKFEHEVVSSTPAGKKFVASGDELGVIKKASSGYTGMKAKLWKIVYENGVEVSRKVVNNSTYRASEAIYNVGTASDNAEAAAIVNNAIASQNEDTINAAIAQANALITAASAPVETPEASPEVAQ